MANLLCYVEAVDGEATPSSLECLGQARRLGTTLGATVFAVLAMEKAPGYGDDDLIATIASGGADKILLVVGECLRTEPVLATWDTHGPALAAAWDACQPALALMPATCSGRELAARVAARVGAAFLQDAFVEVRDGTLVLAEGHGTEARLLPSELDFPLVVTVPPGRYATAAGDEEAEVEVLQVNAAPRYVDEPAGRAPAPLSVRLEVPESAKIALPPILNDAERVPATGKAMLVEVRTAKGPIRIALGEGAGQLARADFAAEGAPEELLTRLFRARASERRR